MEAYDDPVDVDHDHQGGMVVAGADAAADRSAASNAGGRLPLGGGGGGGSWQEGVDSAKAASDIVVNFVADFLARHGWTAIFVLIVWYNCKDSVKRRYRRWRNKRSLADANRPERREVLDRERARATAEKQAQALEAARALAEKKNRKSCSYAKTTSNLKDD